MTTDPHAIVRAAAGQIGAQLGGRGEVRTALPVSGVTADLAVLAPGPPPVVEAVLDVVPGPPADEDDRAAGRLRAHAASGVPVYVLVDPAAALCTVHTDPEPSGHYRTAEQLPFGTDLFVQLPGRTLVIGTDAFPGDPG